MSKGGAGKVYFVLYLAVILELLIIFIERDEAEEGLRRQQQQAIQIVQTILSQLQSGQGATGITASPKDNIVINEKDQNANKRNYDITVSVGDPKATLNVNGQTIHGDDVAKLEYIVSHIGNDKLEEKDLGDDSLDIQNGNVIFKAELGTSVGSYTDPRQTYGAGIPADANDKYFTLNEEKTAEQVARGKRVKVFSVNFKPNQGAGWYRLRFYSETNRIMGVSGEVKNDDTIRIGNIKLTVLQLRQVQKVLAKEHGTGAENTQVEKYIDQLLTADAYKTLPENQSSVSFNVHVVRPELPPPAQPFASIAYPRDTIYWYSVAPFSVPVTLGPKEAHTEVSGGAHLTQTDPKTNAFLATLDNPQPGSPITLTAKATNAGMIASSEKVLVVEKPTLRAAKVDSKGNQSSGIDAWRGLTAVIGAQYDPSSEWASPFIPADHYQTTVSIKGNEVLNRPGVSFKNLPPETAKALTIADGTKPEDIVTNVYWKPNGTPDRNQWVLLLSNQEGSKAIIPLEKRKMTVSYPKPQLSAENYDFTFLINPKNQRFSTPQFAMFQRIGAQELGVQATATCADCDKYGLPVTLEQVDDKNWVLSMKVSNFQQVLKAQKELTGKRFEIDILMTGKGGQKSDLMTITTTVSPR
jgi:hypothetical protein